MADVVRDLTMYKSTDGTPNHGIIYSGSDSIEIIQKFTIPAETDVASIIRLCEIPSNFILTAGSISYDGAPGTGAMDVGIYETEEHGGEAIDIDAFIDGQAITSPGSTSLLDALAIGDLDKTIYELAVELGSSREDTSSYRQSYVLGLTVNTAAVDAASVCVLKASLVRKS